MRETESSDRETLQRIAQAIPCRPKVAKPVVYSEDMAKFGGFHDM